MPAPAFPLSRPSQLYMHSKIHSKMLNISNGFLPKVFSHLHLKDEKWKVRKCICCIICHICISSSIRKFHYPEGFFFVNSNLNNILKGWHFLSPDCVKQYFHAFWTLLAVQSILTTSLPNVDTRHCTSVCCIKLCTWLGTSRQAG